MSEFYNDKTLYLLEEWKVIWKLEWNEDIRSGMESITGMIDPWAKTAGVILGVVSAFEKWMEWVALSVKELWDSYNLEVRGIEIELNIWDNILEQ